MSARALVAVAAVAVGAGCTTVAESEGVPASVASAELEGVPATWDHDHLMDDSFFEAKDWASTAEIQRFLEHTVWDRPSWLAKETLVLVNERAKRANTADGRTENERAKRANTAEGRTENERAKRANTAEGRTESELPRGPVPVAEALVRTAQAHKINPLLLLARLQIEKSLVSPTTAPPLAAQAFAFGCQKPTAKYPNGLDPANAGMDVQLECAATTLENQLAKARSSQNNFVIRRETATQDGVFVRPAEAATSALYAYTPVEGTKAHNGNFLVWTITRRFAVAIHAAR